MEKELDGRNTGESTQQMTELVRGGAGQPIKIATEINKNENYHLGRMDTGNLNANNVIYTKSKAEGQRGGNPTKKKHDHVLPQQGSQLLGRQTFEN